MVRIKICGITNVEDAVQAIEAGADALGFNFYPKSPRCVSIETMRQMATSGELRSQFVAVTLAGVFVNFSNAEIFKIALLGRLDTLQLHGDETPWQTAELVTALKRLPKIRHKPWQVWRAFRCREPDLTDVADYIKLCNGMGLPSAVLLDAYAPGSFGGTGKMVDWHTVRKHRADLHRLPVILAGGLTPDNVAEAILTARPDAVDVASGVESSPGKKDPAKVRDFIAAATAAFQQLDAQQGRD